MSVEKVEVHHLPGQEETAISQTDQAEPVNSGVVAAAVVGTAVVFTIAAVAGLLIKRHLRQIRGLRNLTSTGDGRSAMFTILF